MNDREQRPARGGEKDTTTRLLAIDTSSSSMTVALLAGDRLIAERRSHAERDHSIRLLPLVEEMLESLGMKPAELTAIAAGVGPGSYTGVRIGVTVAKTMAWAQGLPVAGVSSLAALALGALLPDGEQPAAVDVASAEGAPIWIVPLFGARRGQAYTALFRAYPASGEFAGEGSYPGINGGADFAKAWDSGRGWLMDRLAGDRIYLLASWLERLAALEQESAARPALLVFTGETAEFAPLLAEFAEKRGGQTRVLTDHLRAYACGLLAVPAICAGLAVDPHRLQPNYTQPTEAEVKLAARLRGEKHS